MTDINEYQTVERAHYIMQLGSYFTELVDNDGIRYAFTSKLADVWYNQAYGIDLTRCDLSQTMEMIRRVHEERRRIPCIYFNVDSMNAGTAQGLLSLGYESFEREAWMSFPAAKRVDHALANSRIRVSNVVTAKDAERFAAVYREGLPGPEVEKYVAACLEGWRLCPPLIRVELLIATVDGEDAGMTTLVIFGRYAGVYAVATLPRFRKLGIARALNAHVIEMARSEGCDHIFLQTVEGEASEEVFRRIGYEKRFVRVGYTPIDATTLAHG
jgi:GNAT superfamily N-acetyltransferase